jgi:multisubunit Na+/H+ antiporter MnhF subunit
MDLNKLTMGDRVIAISGIVLFVFSFFDWLGVKAEAGAFSAEANGNAWDFTLCWLATLIGIAMVVLVVLKAFDVKLPDLGGTSWGLILLVMGVVAFAFVLIKLIAGPNIPDVLGDAVEKTRKFGIFVGLVATAGLAVGGYLRFQEDKTGRPAAPPTAPPPA